VGRRIEAAGTPHEIRRGKHLETTAGVRTQVGEQAVGGGDARQHPGRQPLGAEPPDRFVGGVDEHAGVAVEHRTDAPAGAHRFHQGIDHPAVGLQTVAPLPVMHRQRHRAGVAPFQPTGGDPVADGVAHQIRRLDAAPRLEGQLGDGPDATAHHVQGSARHASPPDRRMSGPGCVRVRAGAAGPRTDNRSNGGRGLPAGGQHHHDFAGGG